jgi:hypothetical protein
MSISGFTHALVSEGPAADRAEKMKLYGWLIGDWVFDAVVHADDGIRREGKGEIHFVWALDGRAIMDVWILPGIFYGSTLRVYDPAIDAWHIHWSDPLKQLYTRQIGRAQGPDIVQLGDMENGVRLRWSFSEIATDAFRWRGERSTDNGASWHLQADFRARRVL